MLTRLLHVAPLTPATDALGVKLLRLARFLRLPPQIYDLGIFLFL